VHGTARIKLASNIHTSRTKNGTSADDADAKGTRQQGGHTVFEGGASEAADWAERSAGPAQILGELEAVCVARRQERGGAWLDARADDVEEESAFTADMERLHARFRETAPSTFERMGRHVRQHPEEFVEIEAQAEKE
jgi:hypothetical protein